MNDILQGRTLTQFKLDKSSHPPIRARIADNLKERLDAFHGYTDHAPECAAFCDRVQGQEVTLIFTHGDAFELEDDNYWLPECVWEQSA